MRAMNQPNHFDADSHPPNASPVVAALRRSARAKKVGAADQASPEHAKSSDPAVEKPRETFVITHQAVLDLALNIANADPKAASDIPEIWDRIRVVQSATGGESPWSARSPRLAPTESRIRST